MEIVLADEGGAVLAHIVGMSGPKCKYDIVYDIDENCRAILEQEWKNLITHHRIISGHNYQKSMNEIWSVMPENESPILEYNSGTT